MNNRAIKWSIFLLISVTLGGIGFLLYSPVGLKWVIKNKLDSDSSFIEIDQVSNSWSGTVKISALQYNTPWMQVKLDNIKFKWSPFDLFEDQFTISELICDDLKIIAGKSINSFSEKQKVSPVAINILNGTSNHLLVKGADQKSYELGKISFNDLFIYDDIHFKDIKFQSSNGYIHVNGKLGFNANDVINLSTKAYLKISSLPVMSVSGTVVGTPTQVRFLQQGAEPYNFLANGRVSDLLSNPVVSFDTELNQTRLNTLLSSTDVGTISGIVSGNGPVDNIGVIAKLFIADKYNHPWGTVVNGIISSQQFKFDLTTQMENSASAGKVKQGNGEIDQVVSANGVLKFTSGKSFSRSLNVKVNWKQLKWPYTGKTLVKSSKGSLDYSGESLKVNLSTPDLYYNPIGSELNQVNLTSDGFKNNNLTFKFNANANNSGNLAIQSHFTRATHGKFRINEISLTGNNFPLFSGASSELVISPKIRLAWKDSRWISNGVLIVPSANIQLEKVKTLSTFLENIFDFRIENPAMMHKNPARFQVKLGDSVWLRGYGLNVNVRGDFSVSGILGNSPIVDGNLEIVRGNFKKGDKRVPVTGGKLTFDKLPLDNPEVKLNTISTSNGIPVPDIVSGRLKSLYIQHQLPNQPSPEKSTQDKSQKIAGL